MHISATTQPNYMRFSLLESWQWGLSYDTKVECSKSTEILRIQRFKCKVGTRCLLEKAMKSQYQIKLWFKNHQKIVINRRIIIQFDVCKSAFPNMVIGIPKRQMLHFVVPHIGPKATFNAKATQCWDIKIILWYHIDCLYHGQGSYPESSAKILNSYYKVEFAKRDRGSKY